MGEITYHFIGKNGFEVRADFGTLVFIETAFNLITSSCNMAKEVLY